MMVGVSVDKTAKHQNPKHSLVFQIAIFGCVLLFLSLSYFEYPRENAILTLKFESFKLLDQSSFGNNDIEEKELELEALNAKKRAFDSYLELEVRDLATEALNQIENDVMNNATCIPRICHKPKKFFQSSDRTQNFTFLVTFPGSGNTWIRSVIQEGTRIYTGSVYIDKSIAKAGFEGERKEIPKTYTITSAIKSHYSARKLASDYGERITAIITITRDPFDASLAEFNRRYTHAHTGEVHRNISAGYMQRSIRSWLAFQGGYNQLIKRVFPVTKRPMREMRDYMRIEFRKIIPDKAAIPILTMFYEDFVRDPRTSLAYLFSFLKTQYHDLVPGVKESIICAAYHAKQEERFHRHHTLHVGTPLYSFKRNETTELGLKLCKELKPFWNTHKWGECNGLYQKQKHLLDTRIPLLSTVNTLSDCTT